jgi:hypothetical protein
MLLMVPAVTLHTLQCQGGHTSLRSAAHRQQLTCVRQPAIFSVDGLPRSVFIGLKWKSDIRIFVFPGPSLMRPFTCSSKHHAEPAAWLTRNILHCWHARQPAPPCALESLSCQHRLPSRCEFAW